MEIQIEREIVIEPIEVPEPEGLPVPVEPERVEVPA